MNNKAFTTVELVLTIVLVMIIMATITNVTYTYRDRSEYESLISEITTYKNTTTKILYDDILNPDNGDKVIKITKTDENHYELITKKGISKTITIYDLDTKVGINYQGVDYIVPDSNDALVEFVGVNYKEDSTSNLYMLDIIFNHHKLEDDFKIHLVIS